MDNSHKNHILDVSSCPRKLPQKTQEQAIEIARVIMDKLDVVGVLCVEYFITKDQLYEQVEQTDAK